jgi:hypothetical protein
MTTVTLPSAPQVSAQDTQYQQWKRDIEEIPTPRFVPPAPEYQPLADFLKGLSSIVYLRPETATPAVLKKLQSLPGYIFFAVTADQKITPWTESAAGSGVIIVSQKKFIKHMTLCQDYLQKSQSLSFDPKMPDQNILTVLEWAQNQPAATLKNIQVLELLYHSYIPKVKKCQPLWHDPTQLECYSQPKSNSDPEKSPKSSSRARGSASSKASNCRTKASK